MKPPYEITSKIVNLIASVSEKTGEVHAAHLHKPPTELRTGFKNTHCFSSHY